MRNLVGFNRSFIAGGKSKKPGGKLRYSFSSRSKKLGLCIRPCMIFELR
ncbi:MAG: hypothetical protein RLZZ505_1754 [Verrucomicrobiota bacterium]|jgi:hypothetical protein